MSAALATDATRATPFALDGAERLDALFAPIRGMSRVTLAVLAGSVALHLGLVATAIVTSRAPLALPEPDVTSVEVVQEAPKPAPSPMTPKAPEKAPEKAAAKPPPDAYRKPPEKLAPAKREITQAPPAKVEPPKALPPKTPTPAATPDERKALLEELAALRAQEAKLEARQAPANLGMGPLPQSFQAVALPGSSEAAGEAMDYKDIVFSQLAKAKGLDERMGLPGTAGVRFDVDAAGGLVDVEIVHPSGVAALDREALDIVRRAAPFPAPPPGAQRSFTANVNFVAQGRP